MAKNRSPKNKSANEPNPSPPPGMSPERYARLVAEAKAPYKGLRKFIYGSIGISGAIGAFVFFAQILSGRDLAHAVPNLAVQLGVVGLMVLFFRLDSRKPS